MLCNFTTTACCRPEILVRTFASFRDHLRGLDLISQTLYLNIDPVPDPGCRNEVARVARAFFGRVFTNCPQKPNFAAAVKWCWLQPTTEYFFHLEDDWELKVPFDLADMVEEFDTHPLLSCVNLRAYDHVNLQDDKISLCPGLFKTADARVLAKRMTVAANPEKQLRPYSEDNPNGGRHAGFIGVQVPNTPVLRDIGRAWLDASGWRKTRPVHFNYWECG